MPACLVSRLAAACLAVSVLLPAVHGQPVAKPNFLENDQPVGLQDGVYFAPSVSMNALAREWEDLLGYRVEKFRVAPLKTVDLDVPVLRRPYTVLGEGARISPDKLTPGMEGKRCSFYFKEGLSEEHVGVLLRSSRGDPQMYWGLTGLHQWKLPGDVMRREKDRFMLNGVIDGKYRPPGEVVQRRPDRIILNGVFGRPFQHEDGRQFLIVKYVEIREGARRINRLGVAAESVEFVIFEG